MRQKINYSSQAGQDLFALTMLYDSPLRTYIELGADGPDIYNNTYMLEKLGWTGASIDIKSGWSEEFKRLRKNPLVIADAKNIDWNEYFRVLDPLYPNKNNIGYLSFDVDDATLDVFNHFPFDTVKCATITIEHDFYRVGPTVRNYLRDTFIKHGYILICADVSVEGYGEFEDWWVHPELVNMEHAKQFMFQNTDCKIIIKKMIEYLNTAT
jgi:hypothetical protein